MKVFLVSIFRLLYVSPIFAQNTIAGRLVDTKENISWGYGYIGFYSQPKRKQIFENTDKFGILKGSNWALLTPCPAIQKNNNMVEIIVISIAALITSILNFFSGFGMGTILTPVYGFFGGLSGHQEALRSAFLVKAGLSKEAFIGTSVVIACFIDFTRLSAYAARFGQSGLGDNLTLVVCATLSAIAGAYLGNKLLKKITLKFLQCLVAIMLVLISISLGAGFI